MEKVKWIEPVGELRNGLVFELIDRSQVSDLDDSFRAMIFSSLIAPINSEITRAGTAKLPSASIFAGTLILIPTSRFVADI